MRSFKDHPSHRVWILGGMWGFFSQKSRVLAKYFYEIVTSRFKALYYRSYMSRRQPDQYMLREYFWPVAKRNATIHDSFYCKSMGGRGFPTRRHANCHVGYIGCCDDETSANNRSFYECPLECRPFEHRNEWITC